MAVIILLQFLLTLVMTVGIILLLIAFVVNAVLYHFQERESR